ncbi:MAG: lipopolysaccharide heptosyltransferase II [Thermodesulfovibrionales bacterium]|nr:lipopolysaccharide heptosyltransferase II [Thermodesulfovibrionales bacterium]
MKINPSEKILIRGVNWIGDAVMTMPAIKALKAAHPDSKISILVRHSVASVFENNQDIDEIILYDDRFKGMLGKFRLARMLRQKGFSKAILFQNAFEAALIAFLARIPERIGYNRDGRGFLLTKAVPFNGDDRKVHHINYYLNLLKAADIRVDYSNPWIYLSIDERLSARDKLSTVKRPILGINPGATYGSAKRWFPERFAEVANWFINDTGGSVVIFGGSREVDIAQEIEYLIRRQKSEDRRQTKFNLQSLDLDSSLVTLYSLLNLAGETSLRELISLASECDVFVSNDSGPMHIAYAVGTPLVAIFGSTDPKLTGPAGESNVVINADFVCSPCFERTCKDNDMRCMYAITSEDVYHGIKKMLSGKKAVFFDRDGTLCKDADYLNDWKDFEVFADTESLQALKEKGFLLIGISNQSGIARGFVDEGFVKEANKVFIDKYGFDDFYYCPHHPDEHCSCRKPEPWMLFTARAKYKINLRESYIVGDKDVDMLLAKAVGAKGILVKTGKQQESEYADFAAEDIKDAVDFIISHE